MRAVYFDFEFNDTSEKILNLVCVAVNTVNDEGEKDKRTFWLHNNLSEQIKFNNYLETLLEDDYYFVAFGAIAEARSLLSLPYPPAVEKMKWIDLWIEYRCLLNHCNKTSYGKQLQNGKEVKVPLPNPRWIDLESKSPKPEDNYAAACYKLLEVFVDTERKKAVRDIIISENENLIEANKEEILEYCEDDVKYLPKLLSAVLRQYKKRYPKKYHKDVKQWMLNRGEFAARTAIMEKNGYPINYEFTKNFSDNVGNILGDIQGEINELFPDTRPFNYNPKTGTYTWNQSVTREWISQLDISDRWDRTKPSKTHPSGQYSLSVDVFTKFFSFRHTYPKNNLGAQFVRYLKTKQNLNGFSVNTKKKTLWDSVGRDRRVRPYTNIYRSQSSRSQPSSTSFMFLKAAWMRSLVQPEHGLTMGGIDYGSEEFLIGAFLSGDQAMIDAYQSGDVYLWFGKACKKIPEEATKKTHGKLRDRFKSSVLGIQYLMGPESLAKKIENDTGEPCTVEEAQEFINMFDEVFWGYAEYRDEILMDYRENGYIVMPDGWTMWGDNPNFRSVCNMPVQTMGAVIMRRAVRYAQDAGLEVPFTLHDALYIIYKTGNNVEMDILAKCMDQAFMDYFPKETVKVRLDGNIWSRDFGEEQDYVETPSGMLLKRQNIYVDERSADEYQKFKPYFIRNEALDLL